VEAVDRVLIQHLLVELAVVVLVEKMEHLDQAMEVLELLTLAVVVAVGLDILEQLVLLEVPV
tara:strand:+ start:528 stop:713 length:186 start_codon:yes stop_codon:yes gene_type:complete